MLFKNFYGVLCALSSSIFFLITHAPISFLSSNMLYINKDTIYHLSSNWALKWQQFISTSSLSSYSAFVTLK